MTTLELHGLDTAERICFYEHDYYVFSNFSSFRLKWRGLDFMTSEHAYHWSRFAEAEDYSANFSSRYAADQIYNCRSAHEAFKLAQEYKPRQRPDWDEIKVAVMRAIIAAKTTQHDYVLKKLMDSGDRELVEDSWRDSFWGWGPNKDGQNQLGKLWMELRYDIRNGRTL